MAVYAARRAPVVSLLHFVLAQFPAAGEKIRHALLVVFCFFMDSSIEVCRTCCRSVDTAVVVLIAYCVGCSKAGG